VYLGESPERVRVAIKVLHARLAADPKVRRRFLREAEVAASVAAFCTARVICIGMLGERPYIVSEYVPGPSLDALVKSDGPRSGSGLERLAVSTLTALASIHRGGIVHRDFKPGNVILGTEGPVVIDFGIARALDAGQALHHGAAGAFFGIGIGDGCGTQAQAGVDQGLPLQGPQSLPQGFGRGQDEGLELVERAGARMDCAFAGDQQHACRLSRTVSAWNGGLLSAEGFSGGPAGVQRVAFAAAAPSDALGTVELDDLLADLAQGTHEAGAVAAGALDRPHDLRARGVLGGPAHQPRIPVGIGCDGDGGQLAAYRVDQAGAVNIAVGVDSDDGIY
jgi:hypothetical protein